MHSICFNATNPPQDLCGPCKCDLELQIIPLQDISPENRLRLLMIYASIFPEKFEGDIGEKLMQVNNLTLNIQHYEKLTLLSYYLSSLFQSFLC